MKKIAILLAPVVIVAAIGCSKDHEAPTYDVYGRAETPENLVATYDPDTDNVTLEWTMNDMTGVEDFYISVSDSSVHDYGKVAPLFINTGDTVSPFLYDYNVATNYAAADVDSLILYFTVSAVYNNVTFNQFIGPRAVVDSALVLRGE